MNLHPDNIIEIVKLLQPLIQAELKAARTKKAKQAAEMKAAKLAALPATARRELQARERYAKSREFTAQLRGATSLEERASLLARERVLSLRAAGERAEFGDAYRSILAGLKEFRRQ